MSNISILYKKALQKSMKLKSNFEKKNLIILLHIFQIKFKLLHFCYNIFHCIPEYDLLLDN